MTSVSSPRNGHLPKLNSPNLRALGSANTNKSGLLRTFVRSQEAHLSSYALEGKTIAASWYLENSDVTDSNSGRTKRARDAESASGFGTPLLKPRAPARVLQHTPESLQKVAADDKDVCSLIQKSRDLDKATRPKASTEKIPKASVPDVSNAEDDKVECSTKRLRQSEIEEFARPRPSARDRRAVSKRDKQKGAQPKAARTEGRDGEIDQEHEHRLAERQERRRAKKAIVDPKPAPPERESSDNDGPPRGKGSKKTHKKGKGLNIPAGLALMHGFSAKNIGKNRLTVNLDPVVGVFNKGKASAKTLVKKSKATKPYLQLFSEERFLSGTSKDANARTQSSVSDDSETEEDCMSPKLKPKSAVASEPTSKRKRLRSPSPASMVQSEEALGDSQVGDSPRRKKHKSTREDSPVWDIELEHGQLPSGTVSERSVRSDEGTKQDGTVLLDTGTFVAKWTVPEKHHSVANTPVITRVTESSTPQQSEVSSVAPSHSASQIASRQNALGAAVGTQSEAFEFSRYFAASNNATLPKLQRLPSSDNHQSLVSHPPLPPQIPLANNPAPRIGESISAVTSEQHHGNPTIPLRSSRGDHSVATEWESGAEPDRVVSARPTSPHISVAFQNSSPVQQTISRRSSPCLPLGPCSPASPGRATWNVDEGILHPVFPDAVYAPTYTPMATADGGAYQADCTLIHPPDTFHVDMTPTVLSDVDQSGNMVYDYVYLQDEDGMEIEEPAQFAASFAREEQVPVITVPTRMVPYLDREAITYNDESADWDYSRISGEDQRVSDLEVDYSFADTIHEDRLHWSADYAEAHGGSDPGQSFDADFPDDDYPASEAGFASPVALAVGLESDDPPECESEPGEDLSVLGALPRFSQGRALLMGVADTVGGGGYGEPTGVSSIEEDVARSLRGHWLPQKF